MSKDKIYEEAKKRVKEKKDFYGHLTVYIAVNTVMSLIVFSNSGGFGWLVPAGFWGIGLFAHYVEVFGLPGKNKLGSKEWEAKEIQKEIRRLEETYDDVPEEELELKELQKSRRKWDDSDLV